jgi:electron transport complex protein RnfB
MSSNNLLTNKVLTALPQLQCKKCTYKDCLSYAKAVVEDNEDLNKCEPGGIHTENQLKNILKNNDPIKENKIKNYQIAEIRVEECIGCTICIKVCPVDAIIGARHQKHYILNDQCNGCELCISQCPVDCMEMQQYEDNKDWVWPGIQADTSKAYYDNKNIRLSKIKEAKKIARESTNKSHQIKTYIQDVISREKSKNNKVKEYE